MTYRIVYTHGFASSPRSRKAVHFRRRFEKRGDQVTLIDLNEPDFYGLTLTRTREQIGEAIGDSGAVLMGSSFGALSSLMTAAVNSHVSHLILLCPPLEFEKHRVGNLDDDAMAYWKARGEMEMFHYAHNETRIISYDFVEDINKYDVMQTAPPCPTLLIHGKQDLTVPVEHSIEYQRRYPEVQLELVEDDHLLGRSLPQIWELIELFLGS